MQEIRVKRLMCEYGFNPLGVDSPAPRLFWALESEKRGIIQRAYRIIVASTKAKLKAKNPDMWDSGKIESSNSIQIVYAGQKLEPFKKYYWKVAVWTEGSVVPIWSQPASWSMGVLAEKNWHASWIAAADNHESILLRKDFFVKSGLRRAFAYVCGLGQYEMSLNGEKIGNDFLSPGWTKYDKTCLYDTRDIFSSLHEGENAIGIILANGMYNVQRIPYYAPGSERFAKFNGSFGPLKVIAQLRLEYEDGTVEFIGTDENWKVNSGPVTFSCIFGGEDYDARLEQHGWDRPGFDDTLWGVTIKVDGPGGKLRGFSASAPPLRTFEKLAVVDVKRINENISIYDLGQNASITLSNIKVAGPEGSIIRIIATELLGEDGLVDRYSCSFGTRASYWQYTLAGKEDEIWSPKFFYHGLRYLQVECLPAQENGEIPSLKSFDARVTHSASRSVGTFECSNELFNSIHKLIRWAQRSNLVHVITDCPHRERLGWLEQYHLNGPSLRYEHDLAQLYTKCMIDMTDSQLDNGLVPDIAPEYEIIGGPFRDSPEWGSAAVIVPWQQYEWTGDIELLRNNYEAMKRYVEYLKSRAENHIVSHGLGDWYDIGPNPPGYAQLTPVPLTATAFYYFDTVVMAKAAELLGFEDDKKYFKEQVLQIRKAFNKEFFNIETGQYATGSQCANSIPLVMDLVDAKYRNNVLEAVVNDVRAHGNAMTAGDVGYRYLLLALAEGGRSDVIFDMNNQSDKPGYGYQLKQGATSLTEAWNARRESSQNHFMLGQIMEWFYHYLAGIGFDPDNPGFKKIIIKPQIVGDITFVKATYDSIYGKISSQWELDNDILRMHIEIPANTTATVVIPDGTDDTTSFEILSGRHDFEVKIR